MENETPEFETPSAPNKDMWLFLIVLDAVMLCVLGFFLYNHFSSRVLSPAPAVVQVAAAPENPSADVEEVTVTETEVVQTQPEPAELVQEIPVPEEKKMNPSPEPEVIPEPTPAPAVTPVQKKSIIVSALNGSKYRRVTFRWFEPAEAVSIVSGFTNRKPQALKKVGDYWETTLTIAPGTYKFLYIVDGKNTPDPYAEKKDGRSVLIVK